MFKATDQIAYVPRHAKKNLNHPDVEFGFVSSAEDGHCFCRFWEKDNPGVLRTVSCSESVDNDCLMIYVSCPQDTVDVTHEAIKIWDHLPITSKKTIDSLFKGTES